jgi:hypothetical protein
MKEQPANPAAMMAIEMANFFLLKLRIEVTFGTQCNDLSGLKYGKMRGLRYLQAGAISAIFYVFIAM